MRTLSGEHPASVRAFQPLSVHVPKQYIHWPLKYLYRDYIKAKVNPKP